MEPQLKPTTEDQAIARAHRMGQTRRVIVHRLLARDTLDERLRALVASKRTLFDAYARESAVGELAAGTGSPGTESPGAAPPGAASLVRELVQAEQEKLDGRPS